MVFSVRVAAAVSMATLGVLGSHQLLQQRRMAAARTAVRNTDTCVHTLVDASGTSHTFDFRAAAALPDQMVQNVDLGHTYAVAMCRNATSRCFPKEWDLTTTQGSVIEFWGATPECEKACKDPLTGVPVCCTENCEVLAYPAPMKLEFLDPSKPGDGLRATFPHVPVSEDDPFSCPWNPVTRDQFPWSADLILKCDLGEVFKPTTVNQNSTENCKYAVNVLTELACLGGPTKEQCNPSASGGCSANVCPQCCKSYIT